MKKEIAVSAIHERGDVTIKHHCYIYIYVHKQNSDNGSIASSEC
jgi:hypothetical protein